MNTTKHDLPILQLQSKKAVVPVIEITQPLCLPIRMTMASEAGIADGHGEDTVSCPDSFFSS